MSISSDASGTVGPDADSFGSASGSAGVFALVACGDAALRYRIDLPGDTLALWDGRLRRAGLTQVRLAFGPDPCLLVATLPDHLAERILSEGGRVEAESAAKVFTPWGYAVAGSGIPDVPLGHWLRIDARGVGRFEPIPEWNDDTGSITIFADIPRLKPVRPDRIAVPLRLAKTEDDDPARLWVLRESALPQLTEYCRATNELLLQRFTFAVATVEGAACVILRANTGKGPPPVFVGTAIAFRPFLKLPNLYVPDRLRLNFALRRDAIRTTLAPHNERLYWLHPLPNGTLSFRAESIAAIAFRPLAEFIDYRAEPVEARSPWIQAGGFEFEGFQEHLEAVTEPTSLASTTDPQAKSTKPAKSAKSAGQVGLIRRFLKWIRPAKKPKHLVVPKNEIASIPVEQAVAIALNQGDRLHHARPEKLSSSAERLVQLEARFLNTLDSDGADTVQAMWPDLAAAYDSVGNHPDGAVCWLNALWNEEKNAPPNAAMYSWGWLRSEAKAARPELKPGDPSPWLSLPPNPGTTRVLAAWITWANRQATLPEGYAEWAPRIQARLDAHGHWLPIRALWLARTALAARGDVLSLARSRDALAERLLGQGLSLELDVPTFLRFAGEGVRERYHEARRWLIEKRELIHQWIGHLPEETVYRAEGSPTVTPLHGFGLEPDVVHSVAYADLMIAWGLTRFVETNSAEPIRRQAWASLPASEPVHAILRDAFDFRISQVREGRAPKGPWPEELLRKLDALPELSRYAVDKLREHSRILEPDPGIDAYRPMLHKTTAFKSAAQLDRESVESLTGKLDALLKNPLENLGTVVMGLLGRITEFDETPAQTILKAILPGVEALAGNPRQQAKLIDKGLAAATHWDHPQAARGLALRFLQLTDGRGGWDVAESVTAQVFRSLRKLGLKAEADRVLNQIATGVTRGQGLNKVRLERGAEWPVALRVLLHVAAGWYFLGRDEDAHAILDEARRDLFSSDLRDVGRTKLALTYANTLGQAPVRIALGRFEELFQRLRGITVTGGSNGYYTLKPLSIIESAVRAIVSEDFALGPAVRSWLDRDELVIRRRIREEMKDKLTKSGL
jgi:cellulose synthase operon protein C